MNAFPLLETEPLSPEANHRIFTALAREMTRDTPAVDGGELVEDATISYLQPDEPTRHHRRKPLLLGLIAVAAAVLGVGIMVRDNSARTRTGTDVTPETMPIYLPTVLPDGFTFSTGGDSTTRENLPYRDRVYRDQSKPIGARAVQITTSLASAWRDGGHPIVIQGRPAFDTSDRDLFAIRLADGPVSLYIAGRGVSYAEIEQIAGSARATSTNPADGANVSSLPDGLELVVDRGTMPPNRSIDATYSQSADGAGDLSVNIWSGAATTLDQWAMGGRGTLLPTTIRGHDAIAFGDPQQDYGGFVWSETKDVMIGVFGRNLAAQQVRQAAESLRQVSSNKWASLLKSKDIPIQDDRAPGSPASAAVATTAAESSSNIAYPWDLPLLVPKDATGLGQLRSAKDITVEPTISGTVHFRHQVLYRAPGDGLGSPALQLDVTWTKLDPVTTTGPTVDGQAAFAGALPPGEVRTPQLDPNGLYFRLSARGFTQAELAVIAQSLTSAPGGDRINVPSLPSGFTEVQNLYLTPSQYRSTTIDYGSAGVEMNPVGSGTIESYAIVTPGSFTATKARGHDGYIVTDPATNTLRLVWVESPGLLVEVKGIDTDVATLQRLADSLQPVSTDAWKKLLATVSAKPETVKAP